MNTIKELIEKYCPNGVEYKKLAKLAQLIRGRVISKEYLRDNPGPYPVYSSQTANNGMLGSISSFDYEGEYLTWTTDGAYAGTIFYRKGKFNITNVCGLINLLSDEVLLRFLYYWLSIEASKHVYKGMGNPKLMSNQMALVEIPIPPLPVQREIVRILDSFTSLEAELEAELEARRKQYEYYRDQLLSFKHLSGESTDEVEWKTLGEVGTFKRGKYFQKSDMQDEGIPCIHYGQIYTYYNTYTDKTIKFVSKEVASKSTLIRPQSIIITLTSENIEDVCKPVAWIGNEDVAISGHSVGLETDMDPKYITYYLESSHFFKEKRKKARGAKVIEIKPEELAKIAIPIPPLSTQRRIVSILDRFESLVNDISTGLPAEIAARHQQYEYYRDQLLTFKRKA